MAETIIKAPYRFVPLSNYILRPSWANFVTQDYPFADGVSGVLEINLTAETELCVGGKQETASEYKAGVARFYRTPDNQPAIPGSSIKGMLRSTLEMACFGHFRQVEDLKLGVRDISDANNFYSKAINAAKPKAGWLKFENNKWTVTECHFTRLHQRDLIQDLKIDKAKWLKASKVDQRYPLLEQAGASLLKGQTVHFDLEPFSSGTDNDKVQQAKLTEKGNLEGYIVVTGQPGATFDKPKAKQREFIFYNTTQHKLPISSEVIKGFLSIHDESEEWKFWQKKELSNHLGVPVFYHENGDQVESLGLARMYRLPYTNSIYDAIKNQQSAHLETDHPDLAGLIFGWMDENQNSGKNNMRGRVMCGLLEPIAPIHLRMSESTVLSGPKASFYPAYIEQNGKGYKTLMDKNARLSGWKYYPLQDEVTLPELDPKVARNLKVQIQLEAAPKGSQFSGKIRFHNLRLIELGALIWSLNAGDPKYHHSLGLGKPYGFGNVALDYKLSAVTFNNQSNAMYQNAVDELAKAAFVRYMNEVFSYATKGQSEQWETQSPQVIALHKMMQVNSYSSLEYNVLNDFRKAKNQHDYLTAFDDEQMIEAQKVTLGTEFEETAFEILYETVQDELQAKAEKIARQKEKEERAIMKQSMTDEDRLIIEFTESNEAISRDEKTSEKNFRKKIMNPMIDAKESFTDEQKQQILVLAEACLKIAEEGNKKDLIKACKKLLAEFN